MDASRWQPQYRQHDPNYKSNYLSISGMNEFDSYNGAEFITDMVAWANSSGFGGYMTFDLAGEYLFDKSGDARWPLSTALYSAVFP